MESVRPINGGSRLVGEAPPLATQSNLGYFDVTAAPDGTGFVRVIHRHPSPGRSAR